MFRSLLNESYHGKPNDDTTADSTTIFIYIFCSIISFVLFCFIPFNIYLKYSSRRIVIIENDTPREGVNTP